MSAEHGMSTHPDHPGNYMDHLAHLAGSQMCLSELFSSAREPDKAVRKPKTMCPSLAASKKTHYGKERVLWQKKKQS